MNNVEALEKEQKQQKEAETDERKSQSQVLVSLASDMVLFYDEQDNSFVKVRVNDHYEVWPIRSEGFKNILTFRYLNLSKDKDKVPGSQALQDSLRALDAKARIEGQRETVHVRVAETEDGIFLDLCNDRWQVVEINKKGWKVIEESPVYFKRSKTMQSLPTPTDYGQIHDLKPFINYKKEDDFKLIIAWLMATFKEKSPFPILTIQGEQGSAKSTTTKVLRALIDPSSLPLRALPNEERDLSIAANNTWILAFDNLSGLSNSMSDALCKVSTGGGLATRKLYSDDEEAVFNIMRPTILNGIDDIGKRQDLLDRSIVLNLPSIEEDYRQDEKAFWGQFNNAKAPILGALCNLVSKALAELPTINLSCKPRMADFAVWATATEKALEWGDGEFINIYMANREKAIDQGLESDPFACAILELLNRKHSWVGNATQLLAEAKRFVDERTSKSNAWPSERSVRNRLRRINPAIKKKGILYVEWENKMYKTLRLEMISSLPTYSHQANKDKELNGILHNSITPFHDESERVSSSHKKQNIAVYDDDYDNDDIIYNLDQDLVI